VDRYIKELTVEHSFGNGWRISEIFGSQKEVDGQPFLCLFK